MEKKEKIEKALLILVLVGLGVGCRLLHYPPNFSPMAAIALFSGFYFPKKWVIFLPIIPMIISDAFLGFYELPLMLSVYGSFALIAFFGNFLKKKAAFGYIFLAAFISSAIFFLITNFAVWLFTNWYPHSASGLLNCFYLALPFYRNTVVGDLLFTGLIFGAHRSLSWRLRYLLTRHIKSTIISIGNYLSAK